MLCTLEWHRKRERFQLYAYVIMPTHFHVIIKPVGDHAISMSLQSLGSFMAHAILHQLRIDNRTVELGFFAENREPDRTEQHQVWQMMCANG